MKSKSLIRRIKELEEKLGVGKNYEEAQRKYEQVWDERLKELRESHVWDENIDRLEALWKLEKEFARKEKRQSNFAFNVAFVGNADEEHFIKLRANLGYLPLSPEHRKAIEEILKDEQIKNENKST